MNQIQIIQQIASSKTVEYVYINDSKMMTPMQAIEVICSLLPYTKFTIEYQTREYKMGGTWKDLSRMVVKY